MRRPPDRGARHPLELDRDGARGDEDAVQQRKKDADHDPGLDRQQHDGGHGGHNERELAGCTPIDFHEGLQSEDALRHEQQHAGERRVGYVRQQRGAEAGERQDDRDRQQARELRACPDLLHDGGARRAGVDRKGAEQTRQQAAGAGADEIAIDVRRLVGAGKERVVAAVCIMTTRLITMASGTSA